VRGTRYVMPGDFATVEADGSITLLGRGSIVINSGGEKIFPEEVESAVRSHPDVMDAIVCGAPDERWGQTVAAIIQPRVGHEAPSLESIQEHCRESIAGYKLPRRLHVVDAVERSPSGQARLHLGRGHREHTAVLRRPEHLLEGHAGHRTGPGPGAQTTDYVSARRHGVAPFTGTPLHATLAGPRRPGPGGDRSLGQPGRARPLRRGGQLGYQVVVATDAVTGVPLDYADPSW
jgi:hypothetical protein